MKRILLICFMMVSVLANPAWAQERTVSGKVTSSEDGSGMPGVNVIIKGTSSGTTTDIDGNYKLSVGEGAILQFSAVGMTSSDVVVGNRSVIDIELSLDVKQLSEVVVTGLGVARDVKTLPYASQTVSAKNLNMVRANNVSDALAGKVAGVQLRSQSGAALGRNAAVRIRGAGSLTNKEPLYIIDGTPVTNSVDFNPDDIESINVLKGPAATAIYGQRGDAGVILITSKKGEKGNGIGINVNHNTFFENVYILPSYQNSYAGGASEDLIQFNHQPGMPDEWQSLDGKYYHDYTDDASWGPRMSGQQYIPWYAWVPGTKYTGKTTALVGQPNNIRDFYETGVNRTTNVSFAKANDNGNVRLSYTNQGQTGIMPNTSLGKNTLTTSFNQRLSKVVSVGANISYVNTVINGEFDDAYSNQSTGSFNQWFHRNLDMGIMRELSDLRTPGGRLTSWNHFNPSYYVGDTDQDGTINGDKFYRGYYWHNPYTYFEQIDYKTTRNRFFGDVNLNFDITDKLKASVYYRKNQNTQFYEQKRPSILPYSFYTENRPDNQPQYDYYGTGQSFFKEDNLEALVSYNDRFLDDKFSLDISAGGNIRFEETKSIDANTENGLVVPDLYTISNSRNTSTFGNFRSQKQVRSLYARGNFGYNETFFLDWSVRNDWSSALPTADNSYFYPSIGASVVVSEFTKDILPVVSFAKIRGSWAQVGSDLSPYQTTLNYSLGANPWGSSLVMGTPNTLVDPNIRPSLSSSYEAGLDMKFFTNRIGFGVTYYNRTTIDEIISVQVSGASGFTNKLINAGEINVNGIEFQIDATPVKTGDFRWDVNFNISKNNSVVNKLAEGVDAYPAPSGGNAFGTRGAVTYHVEGERWGQLRGTTIKQLDGKDVIDPTTGLYVASDDPIDFGSVLPDFTGGFINNLSYKNFNLAMSIDFQKGGLYYSLSDMWGSFSGLTARTAEANDKGNPVRDAVEDGGGVHVTGVDADGAAVDMYVPAQDYFHQFYFARISDPHVYDLTFVKLRELSFGYQIPVNKLGAIGKVFTSASVSVVGRNLWLMYAKNYDRDPSEISGEFGENGQLPSTRQIGFNIKFGL